MGVYIHIPFCRQKCYYCDFHSIVVGGRARLARVTGSYLISLQREALLYKSWPEVKERRLASLFIGGGTPTLLPPGELAGLIRFMQSELSLRAEAEITIEANPNTISRRGMQILASAGVNRVSLGAQAFQNGLLRSAGRTHSVAEIAQSVEHIKNAGIHNINLDLMFGLPGQTLEQWAATLESAVALGPTHLSCYGLIVEESTPFGAWKAAGLLDLPSDDEQAEMYASARKYLKRAGYEQYEVSNFCLPGYQCRHNLLYWHNRPFLGLGSGAAGYLQGLRYTNTSDVERYISDLARNVLPVEHSEKVGPEQEMDETMMVGMRLLQGVEANEFKNRFGIGYGDVYGPEISELIERGLVKFSGGYLRLTERGLYLQNQVSGAFLR